MGNTLPQEADAVVIGGGVVGSAITYMLVQQGFSTVLLERDGLACAASGGNLGFVDVLHRPTKGVLQMILDALPRLENLSQELGVDIEYRSTGGIITARTQKELEVLKRLVTRNQGWGLECSMITPDEVQELEPRLNTELLLGAAYSPLEGRLNPFQITIGFATAARRMGARIFTQCPVVGFEVHRDRIEKVMTQQGAIGARYVINATGAWTRQVANWAGVDVPVKYHRGEAMVTEPVPPLLQGIITAGDFFVVDNREGVRTGACINQAANGNMIIAQATSDVEDYDNRVTQKGIKQVIKKAADILPSLKDISLIRMWGSVTPYTDDRLPVFGWGGDLNNYLIVSSFSSSMGIAVILGEMAASYLLNSTALYPINEFSTTRSQ